MGSISFLVLRYRAGCDASSTKFLVQRDMAMRNIAPDPGVWSLELSRLGRAFTQPRLKQHPAFPDLQRPDPSPGCWHTTRCTSRGFKEQLSQFARLQAFAFFEVASMRSVKVVTNW